MILEYKKMINKLKKSEDKKLVLRNLLNNQMTEEELGTVLDLNNNDLNNILSFLKENNLIYDHCYDDEYNVTPEAIFAMRFQLDMKL